MRKIDKRLTMRIVRSGSLWGKGSTVAAALANFRRRHGVMPENYSTWAVVPDCEIYADRFINSFVAGVFVQPVDITGERVVTYA